MTTKVDSDHYRKGLELAEAGRHQEALECIQGHLYTSPNDAEALNDAGAILYCLGRLQEALDYFIKARGFQPDSAEIIWNLAEAYLLLGRPGETVRLFEDMKRLGVLNADLLNRTANVFLNEQDKSGAIEVLLSSLQMVPNQEVLEPMIEIIRSKRPKIAFICGGDGMTFVNEIVEFAKQRFEVRVFQGQTEQQLYALMQWCDIAWFEWCTNIAVSASKMTKICKNIIRLHRYEAYGKWPREVNWENIDVLITVGNKVTTETLISSVPGLESLTSMVTVANGVNLEKFTCNNRQSGKNIAFLANLRMVKNPAMVLQCMQKLHYIDPEYRLFFGGVVQDQVVEQYMRHMIKVLELEDVVFFDGWQQDVCDWLQDKHYIVSTSICEGHPVGILEAMACGLKPVIHNFMGAEDIFPSEYLFNISEEFCEQVLSDKYEPYAYRKFVENNYSLKKQLSKINNIFTQFEAQIDSESQHEPISSGLSLELPSPLPACRVGV